MLRLLVDRYRYSTWMHAGRMTNHMMSDSRSSILGNEMMQHAGISSEEEFIKHMIPHHQEAVDTASRLNAITQNPEIKKLTADIVSAQQKEIAMMSWWVHQRYSTGTIVADYKPMMRNTSTLNAITTIEKMRLEDMIQHHMGAIMMAQSVLKLNPRAEVATFAHDVINVQSHEIVLMKKLLQKY